MKRGGANLAARTPRLFKPRQLLPTPSTPHAVMGRDARADRPALASLYLQGVHRSDAVDGADLPNELEKVRHNEGPWLFCGEGRFPVRLAEVRCLVAGHEPYENLRHDARSDGTEPGSPAVHLRFFEDVVPERRCLIEAVLFCDRAIGARRDLCGG